MSKQLKMLEIANELNGMDYDDDYPESLLKQCKENGVILVRSYSDDITDFQGFVEQDQRYESEIYVSSKNLRENGSLFFDNEDTEDCECKYYESAKAEFMKDAKLIKFIEDGKFFRYETEITHEKFNILEDGDIYCQGIVFSNESI